MTNDIVVQGDLPRSELHRRMRAGELVSVYRGIYVRRGVDPAAAVRREWTKVVGHIYPGAVVTDRSVRLTRPDDAGRLYVAIDHRPTSVPRLPGLAILARQGLPPQPDDMALPNGIFVASDGRAIVENLQPRRARSGGPRRTLSGAELGDWLAGIRRPERLERARQSASRIAGALGSPAIARRAADLFDAAAGWGAVATPSRRLSAGSKGRPFDAQRITSFRQIADALRGRRVPRRESVGEPTVRAFYESYFSNFIEGTEFTLEEARRIVLGGEEAGRAADAHDIRSVYHLVVDANWAGSVPSDAEDFLQLLSDRHAHMMSARPETRPGRWKTVANRVGSRYFVSPEEVGGTLTEAYGVIDDLDDPYSRALLTHYVVTAVHPFADGNGRSARLMMNAELEHAGYPRIVIPTSWRDNYLSGLQAFEVQGNTGAMLRSMDYAYDWSTSIDWASIEGAEHQIVATNGLLLPDEAREQGRQLLLGDVRDAGGSVTIDTGTRRVTEGQGTEERRGRRRVLNQCPHVAKSTGRRCRNRRWSGAACRGHGWVSPWG